jgi:hypothetical protein
MSFLKIYPNLHRFVEIGGTVEIGSNYDRDGIVYCYDEGGTIFEDEEEDIEKALKLADKAIKEWLIEIGDEGE